jgi:tRNA A37 threonylcarbamoyladenosine biosynthesis protein TsaE
MTIHLFLLSIKPSAHTKGDISHVRSSQAEHPFKCVISGPTGSGKSTFCIRFLQNLKALCTEPTFIEGIIWCYSEKPSVPHEQLSRLDNKNIRFHEGLPENFNSVNGEPWIIILDDLLNYVYSKDVCV